jgi:hypothetical protein
MEAGLSLFVGLVLGAISSAAINLYFYRKGSADLA